MNARETVFNFDEWLIDMKYRNFENDIDEMIAVLQNWKNSFNR